MKAPSDSVIVGTFFPKDHVQEKALTERKNLIARLSKFDIHQISVQEMWPRDSFVFHRNSLFKQSEHGNYADGGFLYVFPGLIVCSSSISEDENSYAYRILKLWRLYHERAEVLPPPDLSKNPNMVPHIDYVVLPIPQRKLLIVDEDYFIENHNNIGNFCRRRGYEFKTVYDDNENPIFPCNSLVVETNKGLLAFINERCDERFVHTLKCYDIDVCKIPFSNNSSLGGGIHCATNTVPSEYLERAMKIFGFDKS